MSLPKRKCLRMETFDYSAPGSYFVTVNAYTHAPWFGIVAKGLMHPNPAGKMLRFVWNSLPDRFPGIMADAIVVMPDHVHGIVMLGTDPEIASTPTLGDVVGAFKSITAIEYGRGVRESGWRPYKRQFWQRSFRDTIIRSDRALEEFRAYIEGNPGRWTEKYER
jgi:putative transposase